MNELPLRRAPLAGVCSALAGVAWVAWIAINSRTHGGLDAGPAAVGEGLARIGSLLMVAWNLLLLPAALELESSLNPRGELAPRVVTLAGMVSLVFWAFGGATRTIGGTLETTYIFLSAVWWGGVGFWMLRVRPMFARFTIVLAAFALWDAIVSGIVGVPFSLFLTAAPKLPLSIVWDFWLAWVLLDPRAHEHAFDSSARINI